MDAARRFKLQRAAIALAASLVASLINGAAASDLKRLVAQETIDVSSCDDAAAARFKPGTRIGERTLGSISFNFERFFLAGAAMGEPVTALQAWTLRYSGDDVTLIRSLGGEERAALSLCAIYRAIEKGETGASSGGDRSSFAFARSPVDGRLWAIHWFVNHNGQWVIGAADVPHPQLDWPSGSRLFGRATTSAEGPPR